jgi:TPP-dependent trihydroxycyclohexane-1,2-dione (THcHDO) dehydratase
LRTPDQQLESRTNIERGRRAKAGYVPHHLPGTNEQLKEFCERVGLPFEATRGGKATIYPEYQLTLKALMGKSGMKHAD